MALFPRLLKFKNCKIKHLNFQSYSTLDSGHDLFSTNDFPINEEYLQNEHNQQKILANIRAREMSNKYSQLFEENLSKEILGKRLINLFKSLPNDHHPIWNNCEHQMKIIEYIGIKKNYNFKPLQSEDILHKHNLAYFSSPDNGNLGKIAGPRSYLLFGQLAKLSRTLARWTMNKLINEYNFIPVVTPNLIYSDLVRACGFEPFGNRTQVYSLNERNNICIAGTAEIPLASMNLGENFSVEKNELPKKYCSLSRCYRAEAKSSGEMSGLYRVHYFDKVEMFGVTEAETTKSDKLLEEFVNIQKNLFEELGLHFRIVDMPPNELGLPAYRKFDIEAYMPGRDFWGEISSASNCTDYQSKRLNITYDKFYFNERNENLIDVQRNYVHTINGTACAVPRIIIAIVEQNQINDKKRYIEIPSALRPLMKCDRIVL